MNEKTWTILALIAGVIFCLTMGLALGFALSGN